MSVKPSFRTIASFAGTALLAALIAGSSFRALRRSEETAAERKHTYEVLKRANALLSELKDAETSQHSHSLTGVESVLDPYLAAQRNVPAHLAELRRMTLDPASRRHLDVLATLIPARLEELSHAIDIRRSSDAPSVPVPVAGGLDRRLADAIRNEMTAFGTTEDQALALHDEAFRSSLRVLFALIVAGCAGMLLFVLSFTYLVSRDDQHRLNALVHLETEKLLARQEETSDSLRRAYGALHVSEARLSVTLQSIGDAVIATDADGRVTILNPLAEKLTGWTQSEAASRPADEVFRLVDQETREPSTVPLKEALAQGEDQHLPEHAVLISRDGGECAIADSCAPIRDPDGKVVGAVLVFRDVTEETAAQHALRDSAVLLQTILNTVVDGIITLSPSGGVIETANPAAEKMFGYATTDFIGLPLSLLIPALDLEQSSGLLGARRPHGESNALGLGREVTGQRRSGRFFPLELAVGEMWLGGSRHFTVLLRDITARKVAEEALKKAGALQHAIFNSANFSSIATDAKGVIQIFNVGAERMLGYKAAEVVNTITPADISDAQEVVARAEALSAELATTIAPGFEALVYKASRGIEDIYELTYIRKDGSRFPAVVSVTALRDDHGAVIGYLLIGTDNSARKRAEEALLAAGALQTAIFNSANFSSIATDAKGVIQIFNVGAERMLGYAAADVLNKITPADISDPQEVIARAQALSRELETPIQPGFDALVFKASRGIEDIYELTYIRKDGSRFPAVVSVTALRDDHGAVIGYLLIGTDNTARKQVEAEQERLSQRLRDHQFYTRSLFEANIDALMTTDPGGIITDVNKQMEALTGCTRDELIGAPFKSYFTDPDRAEASIRLVLSEKKVTNYELTASSRDGKDTVVSFNATTFYDRDRRLQGVFAAARDVTERRRLDQVLQEKNVELESARSVAERANLAKSEFLSSMSHELRSPLNAILGFAQLMESDSVPPTPSQVESIAQILQAGWHLLRLIDEILDLAKVESGQVPLSREPVSLTEVILECQGMLEPLAQQRRIRMSFPRLETPFFVSADRTRVKQVLINLVSNAIKYNSREGSVDVTCAELTPGRVRVSIVDSGPGLSPEQLPQLFQPFHRLGQEAGPEEGTGIGLVVAKRLVELMGGTIGVGSTVGVGSVFWFELTAVAPPRLASGEFESVPREPRTVSSGFRRYTLLYVEDNPANLRLVEQILARQPDIRLLTAVDGTSGIEVARAALPDVILMDINLPGINGFQALNILRSDPATAGIPVIAVSANAMPVAISRGETAGFFRYITKPIKVNEFMETLRLALELVGSRAPAGRP
ncbi:MAG: PAS domain S-box protein [Holophagales bacterium]|nr:PAS domain S-box protein [Holophagales bacterium]